MDEGNNDTAEASARLRAVLESMGSVLVAFSGGVDSTLLLAFAGEVLGHRAAALTATSETLVDAERGAAEAEARRLGVRHIVVESHELAREAYRANAGDRCFHCKSELYEIARRVATREGIAWVADGTILDDLDEHRPGLAAARAQDIRHPLVEAGFTKRRVREVARLRGLPVWDKPAAPCLGSRIAVGTRVTPERLRRVAALERWLHDQAFIVVRVRVHERTGVELATVEVGVDELLRFSDPGLVAALRRAGEELGFSSVELDPRGYRRGSVATPAAPP